MQINRGGKVRDGKMRGGIVRGGKVRGGKMRDGIVRIPSVMENFTLFRDVLFFLCGCKCPIIYILRNGRCSAG